MRLFVLTLMKTMNEVGEETVSTFKEKIDSNENRPIENQPLSNGEFVVIPSRTM